MTNPIITPPMMGNHNWTVTNSTRIHVTMGLSTQFAGAGSEGTFDVAFPSTSTPDIVLVQGTISMPITIPAQTEQSRVVGQNQERTVYWKTDSAGLHFRLYDRLGTAFDEIWVIKISVANGTLASVSITFATSVLLDYKMIEADPIVIVPTPTDTALENGFATLLANTRRNTIPLPSQADNSSLTGAWAQVPDPNNSITAMPDNSNCISTTVSGAPGCRFEGIVNPQGLSASTTLRYQFTATAGEFRNTGEETITASTRTRHTIFVLDQSGSMNQTVVGNETKWDLAVKGASIWLDLLEAFRQNNPNDRVGILTFTDDTGRWRNYRPEPQPIDPKIKIVFPGSSGNMGPLDPFPRQASLNLGMPDNATPIGNGLIQALEKMSGLPGSSDNLYSIFLLTDGMENAGTVVVDRGKTTPGAAPALFEDIRSRGNRNIFTFGPNTHNVQVYTVGVGKNEEVDPSVLDKLAYGDAAKWPGYYRLAEDIKELLPSLIEMVMHYIGGQHMEITDRTNPPDPATSGSAVYFSLTKDEPKMAVVLVWKSNSDDLELQWRPQTGGSFQSVVPNTKVNIGKRPGHVIAFIDDVIGVVGHQDTEWRVRYKSGSTFNAITPDMVLAVRDLRLRSQIIFDRASYGTGQPIKITALVGAGGVPVTNAHVIVELTRPGESLGTFISLNSILLPREQIAGGVVSLSALARAPSDTDLLTPKAALIRYLLNARGMVSLPTQQPPNFFADGTNELLDDGGHGDGKAHDGVYANTFTDTHVEGTYTFRFTIMGTTPDGGAFRDTITMSRWVGIRASPTNTQVNVQVGTVPGTTPAPGPVPVPAPAPAPAPVPTTALSEAPRKDLLAAQITITPKNESGEFLGPFWADTISFSTSKGAFLGDIVTHLDGRYSRLLVYRKGEVPVVTIKVGDTTLAPVAVAPGCLGYIGLLLRRLVSLLLSFFRR